MHNYLKIPDGDIFIFGGDISETGRTEDLVDFNHFFITDGNHDLAPGKISNLNTNAVYLQHELLEIEDIKNLGNIMAILVV